MSNFALGKPWCYGTEYDPADDNYCGKCSDKAECKVTMESQRLLAELKGEATHD